MPITPGTRLGAYEVLTPLGAGGMGEVFRARDTKLGREVALKVLPELFAEDPERLARFEREARLLASLNHPRIAAIYGFEQVEGARFLALELAAGESLAARLARGPLPLPEAVAVARQVADGLEAAHEKGIVHRDLKPANVQLAADGAVKVLDFGLAKAFAPEPASVDSSQSPTVTSGGTRYGVILGTAAYMSPEQARGQALDKRTDVWSFGCLLYECLAGRRAFPGLTVSDTIAAVLEHEPDWSALPARTPASVRRLLQRCLRKDPRVRLRDIADARLELEEEAPTAEAAGAPRLPRAARSIAALAALAVVAGLAFWLGAGRGRVGTIAQPRVLRLTWDGGIATDPALSPDGSMVVYASNRGDGSNLDLWLQRVSGGTPTRLTSDPADDRQPSFSPDGSTIAYRSARDGGGLYVMSALGGDARLLVKGGHYPRFSPDGASLAFSMGPWLGGHDQPGTSVYVVPAIGGEPRRVAGELAAARNPVWAPDGKSLLVFGRGSGPDGPEPPDWWWVPLDGRPAAATGAFRAFAAVGVNTREFITIRADLLPNAWTPEGVWTNGEIDQSEKLWRLAVSPQTGALAGEPVQVSAGPGHHTSPALDRAGRVAFRASLHTAVMSALPLDANAGRAKAAIVRLTADAGDGPHRGSVDPGRRVLAFPKQRPTESELWLKDLASGQERHLVTTSPSQLNPIVAPDARHVAYTSDERGRRTGWVVTVDGGVPRRVCDACVVQSWLDSSRVIVSTPYPNAVQLRTLQIEDGQAQALLDPEIASGRADPSPDGRWLAFTGRGRAVRRTWIAPLRPGRPPDESEWSAVDVSGLRAPAERAIGGERTVGWSPDSRLLYMLLEPDGFRCLYAVPIDSGRGVQAGPPLLVQHFHDPQQPLSSTPFGNGIVRDAFVFDQVEIAASIWLLEPRRP